jgi:KamA family protein
MDNASTAYKPKYVTSIDQMTELSDDEKQKLRPVADKFVFRSNDYYQSLIRWDDPDDPIRRIVMPDTGELVEFGEWDASDEAGYTAVKGLEHKYADTALLLVNNVCGAYCRFCFRKRLFTDDNDEVTNDIGGPLEYIRSHREISNILLSGGDPLILSSARLEGIISRLRQIEHVGIIRIGTKMPAFNPFRILNDASLPAMLSRYTTPGKKIYIMMHFNHPRELTPEAIESIRLVQRAGAITFNQTPLIRGVNDDSQVLTELIQRLSENGVIPYYIFICRPTAGNKTFVVPIERSFALLDAARRRLSGLARHVRLCMSHKSGKIEVVGVMGNRIVLRYHRAADPFDEGRVMVFESNPENCWFDDYNDKTPIQLKEERPRAFDVVAAG